MKNLPEGSLWKHWADVAARHPEKPVLIDAFTNQTWTARALSAAALAFSDHLLDFQTGSRVAFRLPNGADWFSLFLALQRAGLTAVPLDAAMPSAGCMETAPPRRRGRALPRRRVPLPRPKHAAPHGTGTSAASRSPPAPVRFRRRSHAARSTCSPMAATSSPR